MIQMIIQSRCQTDGQTDGQTDDQRQSDDSFDITVNDISLTTARHRTFFVTQTLNSDCTDGIAARRP